MTTASAFELLAAIDLRGGRVVRLRQGDFGRETAYDDDPVEVAGRFAEAGARWLHVVDLDGARIGRPAHLAVVRSIREAVGGSVRIELAGGLRSAEAMDAALAAGADRVVLGTVAVRDPDAAGQAVERFGPDRVAVALDVRDGRPMVEGWHDTAGAGSVDDTLRALADRGVTTFEVTAIESDGMLGGPDLGLLRRLASLGRGRVIASGGIARIEDLGAARDAGCTGAIVGRALYEGRVDLRAAVVALSSAASAGTGRPNR